MKKSRFRAFVPFSGESRAEMDRPRSGRDSDSKPDRADPRSKSGRGVVGGASQSPMLKEPLCGFSSPKTNVVTEPRYLDRIWTTARYCWPCFPMAVTFAGSGVMLRILQQGTALRDSKRKKMEWLNARVDCCLYKNLHQRRRSATIREYDGDSTVAFLGLGRARESYGYV